MPTARTPILIGMALVAMGAAAFAEQEMVPSLIAFDNPPKVIHMESTGYPEEAREQGCEGVIYIHVFINVMGGVDSVEVREEPGCKDPVEDLAEKDCSGLAEAALQSALKCRFEPATLKGEPVASSLMLPYEFKLRDSEK